MFRPTLIAALALFPTLALAEDAPTDGVAAPGILSDQDLYRLATCGAPPGGKCRGAVQRWNQREVTVTIALGDDPVPPRFETRLQKALTRAIAQINGAGAGLQLRFTPDAKADITIRPTDLPEGTVLTEKPGFSGAGVMGVGYMTVWSNDDNAIVEAVILISTEITQSDLPSVMLEEVTQSLGFLYDIDGPAYEGVSILSQTSNATVTIKGQDRALLRMHYPPNA
jgi:Protein of unknown function (DUF2927)